MLPGWVLSWKEKVADEVLVAMVVKFLGRSEYRPTEQAVNYTYCKRYMQFQ
jgi:hypothetical protein